MKRVFFIVPIAAVFVLVGCKTEVKYKYNYGSDVILETFTPNDTGKKNDLHNDFKDTKESTKSCVSDEGCTNAGIKKCVSDTSYAECIEVEEGCYKWSESKMCESGMVCKDQGVCGCDNECSDGDKRCYPGSLTSYQICLKDGNGCYKWSPPNPCKEGEICNSGECETECKSDCEEVGEVKCLSDSTYQMCEEVGENCLKYGEEKQCDEGMICVDEKGGCVCNNECSEEGEKKCVEDSDTQYKECVKNDAGCLVWSGPEDCDEGFICDSDKNDCVSGCVSDPECSDVNFKKCVSNFEFVKCEEVSPGCFKLGEKQSCGENEICENGECTTSCSSNCETANTFQCKDETTQLECVEVMSGCFKWGNEKECGEYEKCNPDTGKCECENPCTEGDQYCDDDGYLIICGKTDSGCTYEVKTMCPENNTCIDGSCQEIKSPVINCGEVTFNLFDAGYTEVYVAGTFNDWSETANPLTLKGTIWTTTITVDKTGEYQYKFIMDGVWKLDPLNPNQTNEGYFSNNIFTVTAINNCDEIGTFQCKDFDSLEECKLQDGCKMWVLNTACMGWDKYCIPDGTCGTIVSPEINGNKVIFRYKDKGQTTVKVTGDFTNPPWNKDSAIPLTKKTGFFESEEIEMNPGKHLYKFIIDDNEVWEPDPLNPDKESDGVGGYNSVLIIE